MNPIDWLLFGMFLASAVFVSWKVPRKYGCWGILVAHFSILGIVMSFAYISLARGIVEDPDLVFSFGQLLWTLIINTLLLPVTIWAAIKHHRQKKA